MSETKVDVGHFIEHPTGAKRQNKKGKGRLDLLPFEGLRDVALVYEAGAEGHGARNWEKGIPRASYLSSAIRHLTQEASGFTDEPHAAQAGWNILCYLTTLARIKAGTLPKSLDDRASQPPEVASSSGGSVSVAGPASPPGPAPSTSMEDYLLRCPVCNCYRAYCLCIPSPWKNK